MRCEATNSEGLQCGLAAGHTGRHAIAMHNGFRHLWPWFGSGNAVAAEMEAHAEEDAREAALWDACLADGLNEE